jgi:hypothetical protein
MAGILSLFSYCVATTDIICTYMYLVLCKYMGHELPTVGCIPLIPMQTLSKTSTQACPWVWVQVSLGI